MIPDFLTNTVYLADTLKEEEPGKCKKFRNVLETHGIQVKYLRDTFEWYCRDYMPVQIEKDRFVQFVFRPEAYFTKSEYGLISNPVQIGLENKLPKPIFSRIILDGGNVVKWKDKVIITDQVYEDNLYQFKSHDEIREELEKVLQCRVIIIPRYPGEKTGHADGLVRFVDENKVLVNSKYGERRQWRDTFRSILQANRLEPIEVPCTANASRKSGKGLYINFLQVGNLVVVPQFDQPEIDKQALTIISDVFGNTTKVIPFEANWIAEYGGVFNCGTWTVWE